MSEDIMWWIEAVAKVIATSVIVIGYFHRKLNAMITTKIKEQIDEAMKTITATTTNSVNSLKQELHQHSEESERKSEERAGRITNRIDELFAMLADRGK